MIPDYLQQALRFFNTEHPNWYGFAKNDSNGNKIPNEQRMQTQYVIINKEHEGLVVRPTDEEINSKVEELRNAEPLRLLREERNQKLQETDWTQYRDVSLSNDSDWQTYRQSLRDLPQNFSPIIDVITEDGYPIVKEQTDWPEKPS